LRRLGSRYAARLDFGGASWSAACNQCYATTFVVPYHRPDLGFAVAPVSVEQIGGAVYPEGMSDQDIARFRAQAEDSANKPNGDLYGGPG
jgi:hypothetical protein